MAPMGFVRGGRFNYWNGLCIYDGKNGFFWTPKSPSENSAYNLLFSDSSENAKDHYLYGIGYSVRCLAR